MAYDCLVLLHSITELEQLNNIPGLRLHNLVGDRQGKKSFWIGKTKYRVCFIWKDRNAHQVEIVDYH
ncbi:MAG: type II toxin-antitoxin system RelE/ParE family toxin [Candidatus Moeniiplasma glomeromycotorum]|nr:type II toxin-antitoxin system RelE/ParE family toxin [Candidatus Moeniiplasma glomeromycotorum]MCE8169334.1 type II toxin-antitoxin system RelE/ParE family toxin [Candidatus Moeniiplasma glomeromycotorum]